MATIPSKYPELVVLGHGQTPAETYSERTARALTDSVAYSGSVTSIFETVAADHSSHEFGIVPVEHSITGDVGETLDALDRYDVAILLETVAPIRTALLAQDDQFETIESHPQALIECKPELRDQWPDREQRAASNTARAVKRALDDPKVAAVSHPENAIGSLEVLATGLHRTSNPAAARFLVIGPSERKMKEGEKTSILIRPNDDYPGLLTDLLTPFSARNINLTRTQSRPAGGILGNYQFHLDIEAALDDPETQAALRELRELFVDCEIDEFGSFPVKQNL